MGDTALPRLHFDRFSLSLFQHRLRQFRSRKPGIVALVFGKILKTSELFHRHDIFGGLAVQTLGLYIQAPRRLLCGLAMQLLPFAAEQPIEKYFCRVWVRRIFDHTDDAVTAADVGSFSEVLANVSPEDSRPGTDRNPDSLRQWSEPSSPWPAHRRSAARCDRQTFPAVPACEYTPRPSSPREMPTSQGRRPALADHAALFYLSIWDRAGRCSCAPPAA